MKEFYIEVSFPPYPNKGRKVRVFQKWDQDRLSPCLTHLYRVKAIDRFDALALALSGKAFTMISPGAKVLTAV